MLTPIPDMFKWTTEGYDSWRKKSKKSDSRKTFLTFIKKKFLKGDVYVEHIVEELFWQIHSLQQFTRWALETMTTMETKNGKKENKQK